MRKPPTQKPGKSEQVVCTPPEFIEKLKHRLAIHVFSIDLAADSSNSIASQFYDEEIDSLTQPWSFSSWGFCNPPYSDIRPWVHKAWVEAGNGAKTAVLVPSSTGSNWWRDWVDSKAHVLLLNGRLTFSGHTTPYPKDLTLLLYTPFIHGGYEVWDWRNS